MADIGIKLMALLFWQKAIFGENFINLGQGAGPPKSIFYPGDLETSNSACIISNQFETKLHWQVFYYKVFRGLQGLYFLDKFFGIF